MTAKTLAEKTIKKLDKLGIISLEVGVPVKVKTKQGEYRTGYYAGTFAENSANIVDRFGDRYVFLTESESLIRKIIERGSIFKNTELTEGISLDCVKSIKKIINYESGK